MPIRTLPLPVNGYNDNDSLEIDESFARKVQNIRSTRERIQACPGGVLVAPTPIPSGGSAGLVMDMGTFFSPSATGMQTIAHGLRVTPVAMILMSVGNEAGAIDPTFRFGYGFTDGTDELTASITALDNTNPSECAKAWQHKVFATVHSDTVARTGATFVSWNDSSFTINWDVINAISHVDIMTFVVFGGSGLSAKVLEWSVTTSAGSQSITGVGFEPQLAIHIASHVPAVSSVVNCAFGLGVMSATDQATMTMFGPDGVSSGDAAGCAFWDTACLDVGGGLGEERFRLGRTSMDVDGFTVLKQLVNLAADSLVGTLCLAGFDDVKVGTITQPHGSVPRSQLIDIGFSPSGGMVCTMGLDTPDKNTFHGLGAKSPSMMIGFFDPSDQIANLAWFDASDQPIETGSHTTATKVWASHDQLDGNVMELDSKAEISSRIDGLTLNWIKTRPNFVGFYFAVLGTGDLSTIGTPLNLAEVRVGATTPALNYVLLTTESAFTYTVLTGSTGTMDATAEVYTGTYPQRFGWISGTDASGALAAWSQGVDNIRKWNGSAFSGLITSGTNFACDVLVQFNNRLIGVRPTVAGVLHPTQIRWCVNGDYSDWSGTGSGVLEVVETSNDAIVTGAVLGDHCYLFRRREEIVEIIATGSLSPVFRTQTAVPNVGCLAPYTLANADVFLFWYGPDEIYQWDGSQLRAIGGNIYHTINRIFDFSQLKAAQATVNIPDNQYILLIPPNNIFIYDYRRERWDWDVLPASIYTVGTFSVGQLVFSDDMDRSEFVVVADDAVRTIRRPSLGGPLDWVGIPITNSFETKDFTTLDTTQRQVQVSYDRMNTLWRVWFHGTPEEVVTVSMSRDKGISFVGQQDVTVNAQGVGIAFFNEPFSLMRLRFQGESTGFTGDGQGTSDSVTWFSIFGPVQYEYGTSGLQLPP